MTTRSGAPRLDCAGRAYVSYRTRDRREHRAVFKCCERTGHGGPCKLFLDSGPMPFEHALVLRSAIEATS